MKLKTTQSYHDYHEDVCVTFKNEDNKKNILVCGGTGCVSQESLEIKELLEKKIAEKNIEDVVVNITGCFGFCEKGPIVNIEPEDSFLLKVDLNDVDEIINSYLIKDEVIEKLVYKHPLSGELIHNQDEIPFYIKQERIALKNCGLINPEKIDHYIYREGYKAIATILESGEPNEIINIVKDSGLRGRGGGGFLTGLKWEFTKLNDSDQKYIICNADEGDPGAFMDRSILEGDPHGVIEGMIIAGYAVGASKGIVYVRAEYPLAIQRLKTAIKQAREYGFLGESILGSSFNFDVEIKLGAGAFICGEETALMNSVEGRRGEPRVKPPFPAESGLFKRPTVINNVETLVNIPQIILKGSDWFKSIGTENSKGTKVFALAGKINNVGLVEVPMGTTLNEIIYDIGGGILNNKEFKAVQTGGPSGGCIPKEYLDTKVDYDRLNEIGSMMGSGGMIVLDESDCMVNLAKFYLEFTLDESCGKCTPCRIGNTRLFEILDRITKGNGREDDIEKLIYLSETIKSTSLCGLGQTSPNPILSNIRFFMDEFKAHINEKRCPSGVCKHLLTYFIEDNCIGCTKCARKCPVDCISGNIKELHKIDQSRCIKCDTCYQVCPVDAITKGGERQDD